MCGFFECIPCLHTCPYIMANIKTKNLINCWGRDSNFSLRLKYYPVHVLVKGFKTKNICTAYIVLSGLKLKKKKK